jgi:mRNA interferase HicA
VKRAGLIRHLEKHGCEMLRGGGNHSVYVNRPARKTSMVPRHREIKTSRRERFAGIWIFLSPDVCRLKLTCPPF